MKGGVTSGVVYPEAVVRLAQRYRFCGIGGTSAGAIAAVAVAAAEHGRASGGMARLAEIPRRLTDTVDGDPFILSLFQPEPETRRLFEAAMAFQRRRLERRGGVAHPLPAVPDRRSRPRPRSRRLRRLRRSPELRSSSSSSRSRRGSSSSGVLRDVVAAFRA